MHIYRDVLLASNLLLVLIARSWAGDTTNATLPPPPLVVAPSQYWDGVDGQWSSFGLRVGEPAQHVRVLAMTNSPQTMVVLTAGCTTQAMDPVPADCAIARGGTFNITASKTWDDQGLFGLNQDGIGFEANLNYSQNLDYGLDSVGVGFDSSSPTLQDQTVAGFGTVAPFYMGSFGLGTQPVNYTTIGNFSAPSFFTSLRSQKIIPSLSWSYTAGAKYRLKAGQFAQLIFGGYDTSRFISNTVAFTLNEDITRDIVVGIQSITYRGTTQMDLLSTPIYAFIESTDPNIWLPEAACQQFEKAFGLSIDNSTGYYLINATHYSDLRDANAEVRFSLGNSVSGGDTVDIVLPFSAFALQASFPFTKNNTYYFPLKKASNDTQFTLGRAFLQEAYLTVDYERGNFSVSQCTWNDGAAPSIASIISSSYVATNNSSTDPEPPESKAASGSKKRLGAGVIAAIVIVVLAVLAIAGAIVYLFYFRRRRPVSQVPTENFTLTNVNDKSEEDLAISSGGPPPAFCPSYKKYGTTEHTFYNTTFGAPPLIELPTRVDEIHQLPTHNRELDYPSALREMRAAATAEVEGRAFYELHGSEPSELDVTECRRGGAALSMGDDGDSVPTHFYRFGTPPDTPMLLSPDLRSPGSLDTARNSPRIPSPTSPLSPLSDFWTQ